MKFNFLEKILIFSSGTSFETLKISDEQSKNNAIAIGVLVIATGILGFITGSYALYTIFENKYLSILIGFFWGFLIYSLDRYILVSFVKINFFFNILQAIPRLVLASVIALVISRPIELRIFDTEIRNELILKENAKFDNINDKMQSFKLYEIKNSEKIKTENEVLSRIDATLYKLEKTKNDLFNQIKNLDKKYTSEVKGQNGAKPGNGPIAKSINKQIIRKNEEYEKINENIETLQTKRNSLSDSIKSIKLSIENSYKSKKESQIKEVNNKINNYKNKKYILSFFTKSKILSEISKKDNDISIEIFVVTLLFFILEITPVLSKLISKKNNYDYLILEKLRLVKSKDMQRNIYHNEEVEAYKSNIKNLISNKFKELLKLLENDKLKDEELQSPLKDVYDMYLKDVSAFYKENTIQEQNNPSEDGDGEGSGKQKVNYSFLFSSLIALILGYLILGVFIQDYYLVDEIRTLFLAVTTTIISFSNKDIIIINKKNDQDEKSN